MSLAFLNVGTQEMIFIVIIALVLFGGKKLPEIARGLGRGIREFKDASDDIKREISDQINNFDKDLDVTVKDKPASQPALSESIASEISSRSETGEAEKGDEKKNGSEEENGEENEKEKKLPSFSTPENTHTYHPGEQPSSGEEHYTYGHNDYYKTSSN